MAAQLARRLFTVEEYHQMAEAGILTEDDHVELLDGEIIKMTAKGTRHASSVSRITTLLYRQVGDNVIVRVQDPVQLGAHSEPEPDIALVRWRDDFYMDRHPRAGEVFLIIEVADSSIGTDRTTKLRLYAQAGVTEVWIVNLTNGTVEVYAQPQDGEYGISRTASRDDTLTLASVPEIRVRVADMVTPPVTR